MNTSLPDDPNELLTERELAAKLKASHRSVVSWRIQGRLPYLRTGRLVRYCWGDVVQHLRRTAPKHGGAR